MEGWFYHLEGIGVGDALPPLLAKVLDRGWRGFVRTTSSARLEELDDALWTFADASFLPHGRADRPHSERQPILLSDAEDIKNRAQVVVLLDDAPPPSDLDGVERCLFLFDGGSDDAVARARARWREGKAAGWDLAYWRRTGDGTWRKQQ